MNTTKPPTLTSISFRQAGFSLVELMIVIVVMGILAAIAVPIYNNNVKYYFRLIIKMVCSNTFIYN